MANLTADEIEAIVQRLVNANNAADGSTLPAQQSGQSRVPNAAGFGVLTSTLFSGGASFALGWLDVQGTIQPKSYRIYAQNLLSGNVEPTFVGESSQSPCVVFVQGEQANTVVFYLQSVMSNGTRQELSYCPTCTGNIPGPTVVTPTDLGGLLVVSGLTTTNNSPGAGAIAWSGCTVSYNNVTYTITGGNTGNKYVTWTVGASVFAGTNTYSPNATTFLILTNVSGVADTAWNKTGASSVGGSAIAPASITDTHINGTLSAISIAAASIDATKFNTRQLIVAGLTLTDNSPSAGRVAWSACQVFYNGNSYSITSGNTTTTNKFITWTIGATSFVAADSYTPGPNVFLIATNTGGSSDVAWNKSPAAGAIQEANLAFTIAKGYQPASISHTTITFPLTTNTATVTPINVTETGVLLGFRLGIITKGVPVTNPCITQDATIKITVDGYATPPTYSIWSIDTTNTANFSSDILTMSTTGGGNGSTAGDFAVVFYGQQYNSSLRIDVTVVAGPTTGGLASYNTAPQVQVDIWRAIKVS